MAELVVLVVLVVLVALVVLVVLVVLMVLVVAGRACVCFCVCTCVCERGGLMHRGGDAREEEERVPEQTCGRPRT